MTTDLLFKHFHLLADTPGGVQKLRELVLQLAVQGRLVPQNPEEEPASVLLERIREEKERLVREGKIKKQKPLPEIRPDEVPFDLPPGWEWARLKYISFDLGQKKPDMEFTYIDVASIENTSGKVSRDLQVIQPQNAPSRARKIVFKNTVIFSTVRPYLLNIAVIEDDYSPEPIASTAFAILHPYSGISSKFLLYYLRSNVFIDYVNSKMTGIAYPAINDSNFFSGPIPIPPSSEQHRIVSKVDQLMSLCDELEAKKEKQQTTHARLNKSALHALRESSTRDELTHNWTRIKYNFHHLFTTPESIQELRSTILQLAVQGRLVPQDLPAPRQGKWFVYVLECADGSFYKGYTKDIVKRCEEHAMGKGAEWTAKYPPKRIVHWEEFDSQEDAVKREKDLKTGFGRKWLQREVKAGRTRQAGLPASMLLEKIREEKKQLIKEGKIKKTKPLPEIRPEEVPFELPQGWEWVRLSDILLKLTDGTHHSPTNTEHGEYKYVTAKNIKNIGIDLNGITYVSREVHRSISSRCNPEFGDILYIKDGATTGVATINNLQESFSMLSSVALLKVPNHIINKYLLIVLRSPFFFSSMREDMSGVAITRVTLSKMSVAYVPIPPFDEQHRIVTKVDQFMALCDELESSLTRTQADGQKLMQSVVVGLSGQNTMKDSTSLVNANNHLPVSSACSG